MNYKDFLLNVYKESPIKCAYIYSMGNDYINTFITNQYPAHVNGALILPVGYTPEEFESFFNMFDFSDDIIMCDVDIEELIGLHSTIWYEDGSVAEFDDPDSIGWYVISIPKECNKR